MDGIPDEGQPPDLMQALQAIDSKFPQGLRSDRPYGSQDVLWQGPFFGKGGPELIRNPITGAAMPLQPGTTPDTYLQAINGLAQAKARAQANVLRGWNTDQAASEAISKAWGVDPTSMQGFNPKQQQAITQAQVGARREKQTDAEQAQAMQLRQQQMGALEEERAASRKEREDKAKEKQQGEEQKQAILSTLPETMDAIARMDPEEASLRAPLMLANLASVNGNLYQGILQHIAIAAQQKREAVAQQQEKMRVESERRDKARTDDIQKSIFAPLEDALASKLKVKPKKLNPSEEMAGAEAPMVPDYANTVAEKLGLIKQALTAAKRKIPGFAQEIDPANPNSIFTEAAQGQRGITWLTADRLDRALEDPDQQRAASVLDRLVDLIEGRLSSYVGSAGVGSGGG